MAGKGIFLTDPDFEYNYDDGQEEATLEPSKQNLRVLIDHKKRKVQILRKKAFSVYTFPPQLEAINCPNHAPTDASGTKFPKENGFFTLSAWISSTNISFKFCGVEGTEKGAKA